MHGTRSQETGYEQWINVRSRSAFIAGDKEYSPSFVRSILKAASDPEIISFAGGLPNPISFPQDELLASMQRVTAERGAEAFQYSVTAGVPELRQWIAARYNNRFGTDYRADDVLVTTGSQQALDLLGRVLLDAGDGIAVERPTYLAAIQAFALHRPAFHQINLTEDGLDIEELQSALDAGVKLIYLIPNFQNPTGLTYTSQARERVRQALEGRNVILVEDDPYGDLRFNGESLPYIGTALPHGLIMGSFSKTVTPGMRVGYVLTKDAGLLRNLSIAKEASDLHTNVFAQYVILDYLKHNNLEDHLAKIRDLYSTQAYAMIDAMEGSFPEGATFTRPEGGMFLWAAMPKGIDTMAVFPKAIQNGVAFMPGEPFYAGDAQRNTMRLNFTNADAETIREGIRRLGSILHEALDS